jgi:hypothetical protein
MSPKLPVISGEDLIRVLRKFGYEIARRAATYACAMRSNYGASLLLFHFTKNWLAAR